MENHQKDKLLANKVGNKEMIAAMGNSPLMIIPTHNSSLYISGFLLGYCDELKLVQEMYPSADILLVINGEDHAKNVSVLDAVERCGVKRVLTLGKAGKNNALNEGVDYARTHGFNIVHFLDDDVNIMSGSCLRNIQELVKVTAANETKYMLTGSCFLPFAHPSNLNRVQMFWRKIFETPYGCGHTDVPMVSGQSMCLLTSAFPDLPLDEVADDAYICHYILENSPLHSPMIKTERSVIFFEPAHSIFTWYPQKLRTVTGVISSGDETKFKRTFSYVFRARYWFKGVPNYMLLRAVIFKGLLTVLEAHARWLLWRGKKVAWSSVKESKTGAIKNQ